MAFFSPLTIAALIVLLATLVGVVVSGWRRGKIFQGYSEIEADVRTIARALRGDVAREGSDLLIRGNFRQHPTILRFSHSENMPGVNVRMGAPASFNLQIAAPGTRTPQGRYSVRTGSEVLDSRFLARTDHPNQVMLLLSVNSVPQMLQRLCCSRQTLFALDTATVELSELLIPEPHTAKHLLDHLAEMAELASSLEQIPGAHEIKVRKLRRARSGVVLRLALALGVVAAVVVIVNATRQQFERPPLTQSEEDKPPPGMYPSEAALIPNLRGWRVARPEDFDPSAVAWLRDSGQRVSGRITGDFSGKGLGNDVAYLLVNTAGARRIVLLVNRENRYDTQYKYLGMLARVPKSAAGRVKWAGTSPQDIDGDGVLVTRKPDDPASGLVIFSAGGKRTTSGAPVDYQSVPLS